jgi:hypothetical protein
VIKTTIKTLKFARRVTHTDVVQLSNPLTGELETVKLSVLHTYTPYMASSWIGWITYEPTSDTVAPKGILTVYNTHGCQVYRRSQVPSYVLVAILRGDKVAKSTRTRSVGATAHHYLAVRKAPTTRAATRHQRNVAAFHRQVTVNDEVLAAR